MIQCRLSGDKTAALTDVRVGLCQGLEHPHWEKGGDTHGCKSGLVLGSGTPTMEEEAFI